MKVLCVMMIPQVIVNGMHQHMVPLIVMQHILILV